VEQVFTQSSKTSCGLNPGSWLELSTAISQEEEILHLFDLNKSSIRLTQMQLTTFYFKLLVWTRK
jgi:hypothetical protein